MEQQLIYKVIYFQLSEKVFLIEHSTFVKCKASINSIVGNWPIHEVIVVRETSLISITIYEIYPFISGTIKPKSVEALDLILEGHRGILVHSLVLHQREVGRATGTGILVHLIYYCLPVNFDMSNIMPVLAPLATVGR